MKDKIIKLYNSIKDSNPDLAKEIIYKSSKILIDLEPFVKEIKGDFIYINKREMESLIDPGINFPTEEIGDVGFKNEF